MRTLTLAYALAGADCIDIAADPAVIRIAREAIAIANILQPSRDLHHSPWLMVSINDGDDPHFRKAQVNPALCPEDCPQPCIAICPTDAITVASLVPTKSNNGILADRCYGCGRCLPICPLQHIKTRTHQTTMTDLTPSFLEFGVEALEIHTQVGHFEQFRQLWVQMKPMLPQLKGLAVSCPYESGVIDYLKRLEALMSPVPCPLVWQTDGRPMSGDIGDGTTRTTVKYAQLALESNLKGFFQVAGGTNRHTVEKLQALNLFHPDPSHLQVSGSGPRVSGIAYGSYGRSLFDTLQAELDQQRYDSQKVEEIPMLLEQAVAIAYSLVKTVKPQLQQPQLHPLKSSL